MSGLSGIVAILDETQRQIVEMQGAIFQARLMVKAIEEGHDEVLIGPADLAKILSCRPNSIYEKARDGKLPCYRNGKDLLFSVREVKAAIRKEAPNV